MPRLTTDSEVIEIYKVFSGGTPINEVAEKFHVSKEFVSDIVHGRVRSHLNLMPFKSKGNAYASRFKTPREKILDGTEMDYVTGCWEWSGHILRSGYGQIRVEKKLMVTHRAAYEAFIGPIPDGMRVCHKCDNPSCCNPDHLFIGTQRDNMRDMVEKGRSAFGSKRGWATISNEDAVKIAESIISGDRVCDVALRFCTSTRVVSSIKAGKSWSRVTGISHNDIPRKSLCVISQDEALAVIIGLKEGKGDRILAAELNIPLYIVRNIKHGNSWNGLSGIPKKKK